MTTTCNHSEGYTAEDTEFLNKSRKGAGKVPLPPTDRHDCNYVNARNALIPHAEELADRRTRTSMPAAEVGSPKWHSTFARFFFAAMTELAVARGIQKAPKLAAVA